jgi:cobalt/nickel transport system permease protein
VAGASGIFIATFVLACLLVTTGAEFIGVAKYVVLAHLPVIIIEGIVSSFVTSFLLRVKPEILKKENEI